MENINISKLIKYAKKRNILIQGFEGHSKIAAFVYRALLVLERNGYLHSSQFEVSSLQGTLSPKIPASFHRGIIYINPESPYWERAEQYAKSEYMGRFWSSENPLHVIFHEYGHSLHQVESPEKFDACTKYCFAGEQFSEIEQKVSRRATENAAEFVAETFAAHQSEKLYDKTIMAWYTFFGGPI